MPARDYVISFESPVTGHASVRIPVWDDPTRSIEDDQEFLEWVRAKDVPAGVPSFLVLATEVQLLDRYFREAWHCNASGKVSPSLPECRELQMGFIRKARNKALAGLDAPWMVAMENADQVLADQKAAQKQNLRGIPQTFDLSGFKAARTIKEAWPENLER